MSRKRTEKSNSCHIGIFSDKSADYNLAILEILYSVGGATAWQIAEKLQKKVNPIPGNPDKIVIRYKTQLIYSVIQRKEGRLNDLVNKKYITECEGLYRLTNKGNIALAIKKPEILENLEDKERIQAIETFREVTVNIPEDTAKGPLGIYVDRSEFKKDLSKFLDHLTDNPDIFKLIIEETKQVLYGGIDLDRVEEYTLISLLMNRRRARELVKDIAKRSFQLISKGDD